MTRHTCTGHVPVQKETFHYFSWGQQLPYQAATAAGTTQVLSARGGDKTAAAHTSLALFEELASTDFVTL